MTGLLNTKLLSSKNKKIRGHFFLDDDSRCIPWPWDTPSGIIAVLFFFQIGFHWGEVLSSQIEEHQKRKKWCTSNVARIINVGRVAPADVFEVVFLGEILSSPRHVKSLEKKLLGIFCTPYALVY